MRSFVQVLTAPTADTPGTTLLLHFDNKRYLIGSLAEGTQRACVQMGSKLLKVSECFITGRTEWKNIGGLIGMILTLADSTASRSAALHEEAMSRAKAKGHRLGCIDDKDKMRKLQDEARDEVKKDTDTCLQLFSPPNLNHVLATARRFVFRKGMPLDVHEIDEELAEKRNESGWKPYWADENIKMWAMAISPSSSNAGSVLGIHTSGAVSPRKRSIHEVYERDPIPTEDSTLTTPSLTAKERNLLTVKAVVREMFNSTWRLDTLYETPLSNVKLPATLFIRNPQTNKIEKYTGPLPGGNEPLPNPNLNVLVRQPWPGALIETLPETQPAKEAVSYIIRNHTQRGKFNPDRATALKVAKGPKWSQLSSGNSVLNENGETITPDMVLGESKEGAGFAVADVPDSTYVEGVIARREWRDKEVMAGVVAIFWICGSGVVNDRRVQDFMREFGHLQHIVSSPDLCPNNIAFDSVAAATLRKRQIDPKRYVVPVYNNESGIKKFGLPSNVYPAARGQRIDLEPNQHVHTEPSVPFLDVAVTEAETPLEILQAAADARDANKKMEREIQDWSRSLPTGAGDAEIITLGTGSALPSKYRNVSATLLRVPGWGSMLFDCGENTLGQLRRVFTDDELKQVLQELRMIFISHMHADHHLGTVSVIKAWYKEVHDSKPLPPDANCLESFDIRTSLAVVSEPAMQSWLTEFAALEDYGFSRILPLVISPVLPHSNRPSRLGCYISPTELASMSDIQRADRVAASIVQPSLLDLADIQAASVNHCHGARAVSVTFPSGFKVSYSGDCRPSKTFSEIGQGSTVCIHEATFDDELQGDAIAKKHSTMSEALGIAQAMGAKACVLTHFSQRYQKLPTFDHSAQQITSFSQQEELPSSRTENPRKEGTCIHGKDSVPTTAKFRLASDMKVCVAFDYMRVKVGEIPELEQFTPVLLKLFVEEMKEKDMEKLAENGDEKRRGEKKEKKKKQAKRERNNQGQKDGATG
ncbi:hypothetical protein M433DRAFT_57816 [Acidomyces richmondensis BFW]|nr:MAG: hypothetical protein FE78DRAFT_143894 [Acidomyces sp. 'richmondensis']KYG50137.1 hypothetical protein M433DRAFT_57816 [Acidomyces richmondensis BFW]